MSNEELKRTLESSRKITQEALQSPEKSLALLVKAGIATPDGQLAEPYRRSA
jgi:hypothetical protein